MSESSKAPLDAPLVVDRKHQQSHTSYERHRASHGFEES